MKNLLCRIFTVAALFAAPFAQAEYAYDFQTPVTGIAHSLLSLHHIIFYICVAIFIIVSGVMFWAIIFHRKSKGFKPAKFHDNLKLEIFWSVIPFIILIVMAIPSTKTLLEMEDTSKADITVKITGYQWKWHYEFIDEGVAFFSNLSTPREQIENKTAKGEHYLLEVDEPLVLPTGKKVRFLLTAADVIHAWWIPQFGVKKDAIPGFINEMWTKIDEPGVYRGQCAELCGKDHGFMPIVVQAVEDKEFKKWVVDKKKAMRAAEASSNKTWSKAELMKRGEKIYKTQCAACHGPTGAGAPGVFPAITKSPVATGPAKKHIDIVMKGVPGTAMQAFGVQLNDADIAAIVTYERNALGNSTGDIVQPSQVKAQR